MAQCSPSDSSGRHRALPATWNGSRLVAMALAQILGGAIALAAGIGPHGGELPGGYRFPDRVLRRALAWIGRGVLESRRASIERSAVVG